MDHGLPSPPAGDAPGFLGRSFEPGNSGLTGSSLGNFGRRRRATPWDGQDPIREELFSAGRLEDHARSLAAAQPVMPHRPSWTLPRQLAGADALASRLAENGAVLLGCYQSIMKVVEDGRTITPAAEWLIDNYHLVERQVRAIRLDLPPGYYRQLPKLASGPFAGTPRVLGLAWAYVAHTDSRFDADGLVRTVRAYQEVQPLSIGELWAVSITLRTVLIENLRRLAQLTVLNIVARQDADAVADRLLGRSGHPAEPLAEVAAGHEDTRLPEAFAVQLVHRLRDQDGATFPALAWLDQHLAAQGTTAEAAVRDVHRRRGTANVTVRNIITSLRLIQDVDWNDLFERMSLVDDVLAAGSGPAVPGAGFAAMDFPTRNLYRGAVEELARRSGRTELDVAHAAVLAARTAQSPDDARPDDARLADPGYFLLAGGRPGFEASVGARRPWALIRLNRAFGISAYVGAILVAALVLLALALSAVAACGLGGVRLALLGVLGAIPAIDAATALVNRGVASACRPKLLPGMELRDGVPLPLRTLVAVPMLLTTAAEIAEAVERLEIHSLASPDGELHFALLSDWMDAPGEHADGDGALLAAAEAGIARLNHRYGPAPGGARFLLLHRRRTWSAGEARWMGWERKRGKLHELNRLLRGAADTNFLGAAGGPPLIPAGVRYVITLDADTRLLRDTVGRLVGKMAHPLNRPRFDAATGRVIEGYAVLQPRVTPSLPVGRDGSPYQRIFSSLSGIDPYASAVSDVYQDLFGEGSYAGKGIYDVDAFELALAGRVPEGALRHHRWARGDWQLLPWLLGRRGAGAVPGIGRWKMLDNLRRTLSAPLAVAALIAGWAMPFNTALAWTAMVLLTVLLPMVLPVLAAIPPRRPGITPASHLRALGCDLRLGAVLSLLNVTFLAHQAWLMGDAIARTLHRLYRSHRYMLEWMTAAQATNGRRPSLLGYLRRMAGALVLAATALGVAWLSRMGAHGLGGSGRGTAALAAPFALLWLASPFVARWVSLSPQVAGRRPMPAADARALRLTARRTWRYFETFVTAEDTMLPPDNFQEDTARAMAMEMEFGFLLDPARKLLSIGYAVAEGALDSSCYDLLASEARLASFIAIAKGDVPTRHWFRLGRAVTAVGSGAALISWSGSMFEYLMPSLVMRAPLGSLLEQTARVVVRRQIGYAASLRLPWGISESAYNARDLEFTYQYSNFGVPGLGLKRGLCDSQVIAPYATALAAMVDPRSAAANLARLAGAGARGRYGFYEAMDYTPARVPADHTVAVVRAFMAHHQAMSIIAIGDALFDGAMRTRFHAEPIVQATELLLQERTPRDVTAARPWTAEAKPAAATGDTDLSAGRRFTTAHQPEPATHLLSNGSLTTLLTAAGSGCLRWRNVAVTRWREDATYDGFGQYILIKDVQGGAAWSAGLQPSGAEPDAYNVVFNEDRAEFTRRDGALTTTLEVLVSAEDDAEVRRVTIQNSGVQVREFEVTSYAELALSSQADDVAQPAFFKLFVETEHLDGALLATRRRRTPDEPEVWAAHFAVVEGEAVGGAEVETDRARFLGRGRSIRNPAAMTAGHALSGTVGNVLDPIFAVRHRVRVPPGGMVRVAFWTVVAPTRAALLDGVDKHRDTDAFGRAAMLAWTQAQAELHHLGITAAKAGLFQQLAGHAIFASPTLRPPSDLIRRGAGPQSGLWGLAVSGDLPIVLLRIDDDEDIGVARELLQAHGYWRMKGLAVDVVILNERQSSYVQDLQVALETLVRTAHSHPGKDGSAGSVFVLRADLAPEETQALLAAVARVVLVAQRGSLSDQVERRDAAQARPSPRRSTVPWEPQPPDLRPQLEFPNGLGGFARDGTEYVTTLGPGQATPAPWINVIANPRFGFLASAEGTGVTWSANSRENQLTPWSNDPVTDRAGEAFYVRDEDAGTVWTPTAQPIRNPAGIYVARHGRGRSQFEHTAYGIAASLVQFVPLDAPVKVSRLVLRNRSARARRLSATAYVEWVLGPSRTASLAFVQTWIDPETGAMFARNPWTAAFGSPVAFIDLRGAQVEWTGDRREFIGRNGTLADPAALAGALPLSGMTGAGLDPCGALRAKVQLAPGEAAEVVCLLGEAASVEEARSLVRQYRAADLDAVLAEVAGFWDGVLGAVQVTTPDRAMDIMLNGWLLYQTLACRVWARAAFYQASGAYGFRDQLQDGMALVAAAPGLTREHLLRAAARQFPQGDVQHWWLPHSGQGVRTRIADDRAWLAYAVAQYVGATGDAAVLDEALPFLEGQDLAPGQHDAFFLPTASGQAASLFEHCALALDASLQVGRHGLPLMGTGDWNDGMNRVGEGGQGESVWLGWFLHAALEAFTPVAEARGDLARAEAWRAHAAGLQASLEREAWDGDWYLRAFFDDGTPLGSAASEECRIDSIAQSWAVLSGAAAPERADQAMAALERDLIRPADKLALLFTPPFDRTPLDPGYIKGYPPGVRENGGQYTHAAMWSVLALAKRGEGGKAAALFALLNPIRHSSSPADMQRYKVEPYVVAADVYAAPPHVGRGGWTWYTGSAGWMQRAGMEGILGVRVQAGVLHLDPCIPKDWPGFEVLLRHGSARYRIKVGNPDGVERGVAVASLDGVAVAARPLCLHLVDDGALHQVEVRLGPAVPAMEDLPMPEAAPA